MGNVGSEKKWRVVKIVVSFKLGYPTVLVLGPQKGTVVSTTYHVLCSWLQPYVHLRVALSRLCQSTCGLQLLSSAASF